MCPPIRLFSVSVMRVGERRGSILVWDKGEDDFNVDEEDGRVPRDRWDERLVLGSGWLYKQDLKIERLGKQQDAVAQYLDTVDEVLFCGAKGSVRGWTSEKERVEKLEREARGKARKSSIPFPEMVSLASEPATEAVGSGDSHPTGGIYGYAGHPAGSLDHGGARGASDALRRRTRLCRLRRWTYRGRQRPSTVGTA